MKYCIHLFLLIFVWHYAQAQNSVSTYKRLKADSSRANYFSKTDFNKVVFPDPDGPNIATNSLSLKHKDT